MKRININTYFLYLASVLISVFALFPILWCLSTSFKPNHLIFIQPPQWIPKEITLEHYKQVLGDQRMLQYYLNSFIIASLSTIVALIVGMLGAYGFSRYKFPGSKTILLSFMLTRLLPRVSLIVPFFITLRLLKIYNTRPGLVLVYLVITMPLTIWLLKGFFDSIPYEIEEAAVIDGCSPLGVLWKIDIPMILPALAAVGMYVFITAWNEFLLALTLTKGIQMRNISVGLAFYIDESGIQWGALMAASMLMSFPPIVVFSVFRKSLVKGLTEGAVKG